MIAKWSLLSGILHIKFCRQKKPNIRRKVTCRASLQQLLQWKSNNYYILCVCVCVWCVCVCVVCGVCVCVCVVCVCSVRYPACNAHKPYCHLCPLPLYNIFSHYLINGKIFEKLYWIHKSVFWFPLQHLSETFLILRRTERDMIKDVLWSSCKVPVILVRF